jgi:hypothetical protein
MFSGDFAFFSPASLLQVLCQERRSVTIHAWRGTATASIDLANGLIVAARQDDLTGAEAVYRWLAWDSGQFRLLSLALLPAETDVVGPWEELVLEAARRRDEIEHALPPLPAAPDRAILETLLASFATLQGLALLSYDGRVLATIGLDDVLVGQLQTVMHGLLLIGTALHASPAVYIGGTYRLLYADWGNTIAALGVPAVGADLSEAARQLQQMRLSYASGV